MSSITIRSARISRPIALATVSSARWRRSSAARTLERVPGDGLAAIDREVPERLDEVALAGAAGPADAKALGAVDPFQRPAAPAGWPPGSARRPGPRRRRSCRPAARTRGGASGSSPGRGRRPPRRAGPAGPRRVPSAATAAVAITSGAALADVGHPQPPQQPVELVGQRRRGRGLDRHAPKPSQERVERCSDCCSLARAGNSITCAPRCARIAARSPSPKRPASAAAASASSTSPGPCSLASATASASLRRSFGRARRPRPAISHSLRAGPDRKERLLVGVPARGRALQRARRPGRVVLVVDARPARRGQLRGARPRAARPARRRGRSTSSSPSTRAQTRSSTSVDGTE